MASARPTALRALVISATVLIVLAAAAVTGPQALALPLVAAGVVWLLVHPGWALGVAVGAVVLVESEPDWGPSALPSRLYEYLPGARVTASEALLAIAAAAAILHRRGRTEGMVLPRGFGLPLLLLGLGLVAGAVTGNSAGVGVNGIVNAGRTALPVVVVPLILVQVVEDHRQLRQALGVAAALAGFKALAGLGALATGQTAASVGQALTYFDSPANTLTLVLICVGAAAIVLRTRLPRWVWFAMPLAVACLTLSYRRSFWIAAIAGISVVVFIALGRDVRRFAVPVVLAAGVAVALALSSTGSSGPLAAGTTESSGSGFSLAARLQSINPTAISSNREDRYRIGERRNVLANLRDDPVSGLGLGVPWTARYPLSIGDITREYVHVAALWWWMKCGILGLAGYVWLLAAGLVAGMRVWRGHPDQRVRTAALGSVGALAGYALAELTGTFSGADQRASVLLGAWIGLLAVGARQASSPAPTDEASVSSSSVDADRQLTVG